MKQMAKDCNKFSKLIQYYSSHTEFEIYENYSNQGS